jgi:hypothetical protein
MEQKKQFRESMITHLASLTSLEDPSDQSVQSLLSSLSEASQAKDELSTSSITSILSTTSAIVDQVASAGLSVSSVDSVTALLDSVGSGMILQMDRVRRLRRNRRLSEENTSLTVSASKEQADTLSGVLKNYSTLLTSNMVPGQQPSDVVGSTYKLTAGVFESDVISSPDSGCNSSMAVTLPSKLSEQLLGIQSHSIAVPSCSYSNGRSAGDDENSGGSRSISVVSTSSSLYDNDQFLSNPLSIEMSSYPCSPLHPEDCTIELMIPRNTGTISTLPEEEISASSKPQEVTCEEGDHSEHFLDCPATPGLSIQCNGTAAVVSATCPPVSSEPSCSVLLSSNTFNGENCKVLNYTASTVYCLCSLIGPIDDKDFHRSLLQGNHSIIADGTVSVSYVSMLTAVAGTFLTTVNVATKLNGAMVAKGWQALVTLGTLLVFFVSSMAFAHFADDKVKKKIANDANTADREKRRSSLVQRGGSMIHRIARLGSVAQPQQSTQLRTDIAQLVERNKKTRMQQNRYMVMAEEALPKVLLTSKSLVRRTVDEIKRHHRWIGVIYYFSKKFPRVLRIVSLATNIIVMLFMQSLTYDLTKGDDGSCESFKTEEACLEPRSQYSSSMSRCYWSYPDTSRPTVGECHFIQPDNSFTVVIFVAVFSALVSTPIALLADWIIQNVLSVPTTQVPKTNTTQSTATITPLPSTDNAGTLAVVPNMNVDEFANKRKRLSVLPGERLISYTTLANQDFAHLHRDLKEYRSTFIDEKDRKEFDG